MERLQKVIASSGYCSRRKAEDLIKAGVVFVNGQKVVELGTKVSESDEIVVEGKNINNVFYKITPEYSYKKSVKVNLICIMSIKMVHIINVIFTYLRKRSVNRNGGTSNRRTYASSYD